jgi:hypothetical protein
VADRGRGPLEVPVEHEGIKIGSVGPGDRAQIVVHAEKLIAVPLVARAIILR